MLGNGVFDILQGNRTVGVPKKWKDRFGWTSKEKIPVRAGCKTVYASVRSTNKTHLSITQDIVNELKLPQVPLSWKIEKKMIRLGPFVAAYCEYSGDTKKPFANITTLLQDMSKISTEMHIPFYVVPIGGFQSDTKTVFCWWYDANLGKWRRTEYPWPDFCIKKCIKISKKWFKRAKQEMQWIQNSKCKMLSTSLGSKLTVYQILANDSAILPYLPETRLIYSVSDIEEAIKSYPLVYIKPTLGTKGQNVYRVSRLGNNGDIQIQYQQDSRTRTNYINLKKNRKKLASKFVMHRKFLVQQGISLLEESSGRIADFRWLIQKNGSGNWMITARVARIGQLNAVTTNVSTGADVLSHDAFFEKAGYSKTKIHVIQQEIDELVYQIAKCLEKRVGKMGELGIDLGVDTDCRPWVIEVNPNPGRKMLKSLDSSIRTMSLRMPLEYAKYTIGFRD